MDKIQKGWVEGTLVPQVAALIRERLAVDGQVPTDAEIVRLLKYEAEPEIVSKKK